MLEARGACCRGGRERRAPPTQTPSADSETADDDISDIQGTQRLELQDDGALSTPTGETFGAPRAGRGRERRASHHNGGIGGVGSISLHSFL